MTYPTGARRYRLRLYDGPYELLDGQVHAVVVDLSTVESQAVLDDRLRALLVQAQAANEYARAPRLTLHDWATDMYVMDWAGRQPC